MNEAQRAHWRLMNSGLTIRTHRRRDPLARTSADGKNPRAQESAERREVVRDLLREGLDVVQIARRLGISPQAVRKHKRYLELEKSCTK